MFISSHSISCHRISSHNISNHLYSESISFLEIIFPKVIIKINDSNHKQQEGNCVATFNATKFVENQILFQENDS